MSINSLLCQNVVMITFYVFDVILILCAIGIAVWFYLKYVKPQKAIKEQEKELQSVEKIDDDTYIIETNVEQNEVVDESEVQPKSNRVEHFVNQITEINEPSTSELKSNTVVINKQVEKPAKKQVKKEEIENFVIIDGVKKEKTEPEKIKSVNRGTNAFKNSTNFLNSIKEEQVIETKNNNEENAQKSKASKKS